MNINSALEAIYKRIAPTRFKQYRELVYWKSRKKLEVVLVNDHYEFFYTNYFGLSRSFYQGKRILDIGCGPRGSLEWAVMAAERIGLDPLAGAYLKMGADQHAMKYVEAPAEKMPFPNAYFDVACSFNSLDHVDNLHRVIDEIKRVVKPGGLFLLIVEANHPPMVTEPVRFRWEDTALFADTFDIASLRRYEDSDNIYEQIRSERFFDTANGVDRPGILAVKFSKRISFYPRPNHS